MRVCVYTHVSRINLFVGVSCPRNTQGDTDRHRIETVHIHSGFIVMPHWKTRPLAQFDYPDTKLTSPCPIVVTASARLGSERYQCYKALI